MEIAVSNRLSYRSSMGRFISAVEAAATATVEETIEDGAKLSRAMAPSRARRDPRTTKLKESIHTRMLSATQGEWYCDARHALPIELSAVGHPLPGNVGFYWEREGRRWYPYGSPEVWRELGSAGAPMIDHPGNAAQPFLRPAYDQVSRRMMSIAKKHYPG